MIVIELIVIVFNPFPEVFDLLAEVYTMHQFQSILYLVFVQEKLISLSNVLWTNNQLIFLGFFALHQLSHFNVLLLEFFQLFHFHSQNSLLLLSLDCLYHNLTFVSG